MIPGGLVHTIGDGVKLYEVQQSSDTAFRFYDWDRVCADGRPRALHIDAALVAMDLSLPMPAVLPVCVREYSSRASFDAFPSVVTEDTKTLCFCGLKLAT